MGALVVGSHTDHFEIALDGALDVAHLVHESTLGARDALVGRLHKRVVVAFSGGQLLLFKTLTMGPAYLVFPVIALSPMITVVMALTLLRERISRLAVLGVALALVAVPSQFGDKPESDSAEAEKTATDKGTPRADSTKKPRRLTPHPPAAPSSAPPNP